MKVYPLSEQTWILFPSLNDAFRKVWLNVKLVSRILRRWSKSKKNYKQTGDGHTDNEQQAIREARLSFQLR